MDTNEIQKLQDENQRLKGHIKKLVLSNLFSGSQYIRDNLDIPAEIAASYFSNNFEVQEQDGAYTVIPHDSNTGDIMASRRNPGQPAGFEEAIERLVEAYPGKNSIKTQGQGGAFARQTNSGNDSQTWTVDKIRNSTLAEFAAADKAGKIRR